ncbi:unnamed protein product, partial [Musa banksii]
SDPPQLVFHDDGVGLGDRRAAVRLVVERALVRLREAVRRAERAPAPALEPRAQAHLLLAPPAPVRRLRGLLVPVGGGLRGRDLPTPGVGLRSGQRRPHLLELLHEADVSVAPRAQAPRRGAADEAAASGAGGRVLAVLSGIH